MLRHRQRLEEIANPSPKAAYYKSKYQTVNTGRPSDVIGKADYLGLANRFKQQNSNFKLKENKISMERDNHTILKKLIEISLGKN